MQIGTPEFCRQSKLVETAITGDGPVSLESLRGGSKGTLVIFTASISRRDPKPGTKRTSNPPTGPISDLQSEQTDVVAGKMELDHMKRLEKCQIYFKGDMCGRIR